MRDQDQASVQANVQEKPCECLCAFENREQQRDRQTFFQENLGFGFGIRKWIWDSEVDLIWRI